MPVDETTTQRPGTEQILAFVPNLQQTLAGLTAISQVESRQLVARSKYATSLLCYCLRILNVVSESARDTRERLPALVYLAGGVEHAPNALSYVTVVVVAGMLLGGRGGIVATIMSVASLLLMLYLNAAGLVSPRVDNGSELDEFFVISSNLAVVALFQLTAWHSQRDVLQKEHALAEKALAASQYKTDLMARVSHELRTPLGAVLGLADMLRSGAVGEICDEQELILQKVVYNAEYLQSLVDDLLKQSHLHSGKLILKQETFSPAELFDRVFVT